MKGCNSLQGLFAPKQYTGDSWDLGSIRGLLHVRVMEVVGRGNDQEDLRFWYVSQKLWASGGSAREFGIKGGLAIKIR